MAIDRPDPSKALRAYHASYADADAHGAVIAVPHTWPDLKNAEYEVIQRLCLAAETIGATILVIDNDGYPLWRSDGTAVDGTRRIGRGDADFMVSLHFLSPRLVDLPSYYALWQPLQFYFEFGYDSSTDGLLTHDDGLSCASDEADAHVRALMTAAGRPAFGPFPHLFHSPPGPYLAPRIGADARLFYIGINWERLGGSRRGRFHELLQMLEAADIVDIYGPREVRGVAPWEGYATYRGELPFDGRSVVEALNRSGICLAFSSAAHQKSGVMSNRLFEGLAAGCVVISNPHPFVDKYLSDVVHVVDDSVPDAEIFAALEAIVASVRADPEAANARARIGQARLAELFSLEDCLRALVAQHPARHAARAVLPGATVTAFVPTGPDEVEDLPATLRSLRDQQGVEVRIVVLCRDGLTLTDASAATNAAGLGDTEIVEGAMRDVLTGLETTSFCLVRPGEMFFADHLARLVGRLSQDTGTVAATSGLLTEMAKIDARTGATKRRRDLAGLTLRIDLDALVTGRVVPVPGQILFDRSILDAVDPDFLSLLGGQEPLYLLSLALRTGRVAQSSAATCVVEDRAAAQGMTARTSQLLLDALRFDPDRTGLYSAARWTQPVSHAHLWPMQTAGRIDLDMSYPTHTGTHGATMLTEGFGSPEGQFTWVDGARGSIDGVLPAILSGVGRLFLWIDLGGRAAHGQPPHRCTVMLNGRPLGTVVVTAAIVRHVFRIDPPPAPKDGPLVRIELALDRQPDQVTDGGTGRVVDGRRLGMRVARFGFCVDEATATVAEVKVRHRGLLRRLLRRR